MKRILVLLSTYNGELFLREQLDSLFAQVGVELHIWVRDDGSKDSTQKILFEYREKFPNKITIVLGENIGWKRSFFELLSFAKQNSVVYDYYAFCDQDDIWLPTKLQRAVEKMGELNTNIRLYCSNLYYYKDGCNYGLIRNKDYCPTVENCLMRNYATGCTIVFNKVLLKVLTDRMPHIEVMHDFWTYQVAVLLGSVYVDQGAYILYRQHSNNQIGSKRGWLNLWRRRLKTFKISMRGHEREKQANELKRCFGDLFAEHSLNAVCKVVDYRSSIISRLNLAFNKKYSMGSRSNDFWLFVRILAGKL